MKTRLKEKRWERNDFLVGCAAPLCHSITTSRSWAGYTQTNITQKTKYHPIDDALWKRGEKTPYMAFAKALAGKAK